MENDQPNFFGKKRLNIIFSLMQHSLFLNNFFLLQGNKIACLLGRAKNHLLFFLGIKAVGLVAIILYAGIGLGPDEAQYWTWSQALDWGYYSKPPGIAWQIWLGTQLFGQTELGVRSLSLLIATLQAWAVYHLALQAELTKRTAFWCGLCMAFSPLGILGAFFAVTDGGMLLFWTLACLTAVKAFKENRTPHPCVVGGWIAAGALFKWPIYFFWLFLLPFYVRDPSRRGKRTIFLGVLISLLGLLPSLWWNWTHEWATFRHVLATMLGGSGGRSGGNLLAFVGAQVLLISPLLFILLVIELKKWFKNRGQLSLPLFFCGYVTVVSLGVAIFMACFQKMQGNWIAIAYPTAWVILGSGTIEQHPQKTFWLKVGLALSIGLVGLSLAVASLYHVPRFASYAKIFHLYPLKHHVGWARLQEKLKQIGYEPDKHFLASDKYQTTSLLSFYGEKKKRAYFLNLNQIRKNQFSYWPSLNEERESQAGYFVWVENAPHLQREWETKKHFYQKELEPYFEKVHFVELAPLVYEGPVVVKAALIFYCQSCQAILLPDSQLY